jgi:hypothetical protein
MQVRLYCRMRSIACFADFAYYLALAQKLTFPDAIG